MQEHRSTLRSNSETDRATVTVSQHQYLSHGIKNHKKLMAVHYSCAPDDGCM
jgi:hypothetical protein